MGRYEARHIFLALSIGIGVLSALSIAFIPQIVGTIVHHDTGIWKVFVPKSAHYMYGIGFFLITIAMLIIALMNVKKLSIVLAVGLTLVSMIPFYIGAQAYVVFSHDKISFSQLLSGDKYEYSWDELDAVHYYEPIEDRRGRFEFTFHDDNHFSLEDNLYFSDIINPLVLKLDSINLAITRVDEKDT
ncbi:hypothetical protein [Cytobacillus purgationiresistens]|uniref:DUF5673 domain-containing protein n=1 Tax=Cytobacillus purgationiresistens TaxID=863449 RepID=A0ABU0API4_9BACI|nr:hypothetical protein [Cytobacillus purgationiresistens]MDQ0272677.1 hypothetical protein [Cytobacillus purgationiresistens]